MKERDTLVLVLVKMKSHVLLLALLQFLGCSGECFSALVPPEVDTVNCRWLFLAPFVLWPCRSPAVQLWAGVYGTEGSWSGSGRGQLCVCRQPSLPGDSRLCHEGESAHTLRCINLQVCYLYAGSIQRNFPFFKLLQWLLFTVQL